MAEPWQLKAVLSANSDGMVKALGNVSNIAKSTRKYLSDVAGAAGNLGGKIGLPLAALSGVLGGFSLVAIKNAAVGFGELGDAIYKGAQRTGMTIDEYQRMKYVAEQSGVGVDQLEGSMGRLNRVMMDVGRGKNKDVASLFRGLGISVRDANGGLKSAVDILPDLADAFARQKNPAAIAGIGAAFFGKQWQQIAPLLMKGRKGIDEITERMGTFKGVLGKGDVDEARFFKRSLLDLDAVAKGFQMTIAKNLIPVIRPLIDDFNKWAAANRQLISAKVSEMAKDFGAWIKGIDWKGIADGARNFANSVGRIVEFCGGAKNALIALVLVMNAQTIMALGGMVAAVLRLSIGLGGMALSAVAPIAPLQALSASMAAAEVRGAGLVGMLGKVGAAAAVAGAGYGGWQFGSWLNEKYINGTSFGDSIGRNMHRVSAFFGSEDSQRYLDLERQESERSLIRPDRQSGGRFEFEFKNAPPGMQLVGQETRGPAQVDMNVGYRSFATGAP